MAKLNEMRELLGGGEGAQYRPDLDAPQVLLHGHREFLAHQQAHELKAHERALGSLLAGHGDERVGETVIATLDSLRSLEVDPVAPFTAHADNCRLLDPPQLLIQSPDEDARNDSGKVLRFSRARADARTLELAAAIIGAANGVEMTASCALSPFTRE